MEDIRPCNPDMKSGTGSNMCRFLIAKSKEPIKPEDFLNQFADMAEKSRVPDGDRQGDGWGIAYKKKSKVKSQNAKVTVWEVHKDIRPVWECRDVFPTFPETTMMLIHARSASFPNQKGDITYNQPYVAEKFGFVFNGLIRGVKLPRLVEGKIGAQKIWTLIQEELTNGKSLEETLETIKDVLHASASSIRGLNIGISDDHSFAALCDYAEDPEYFTLHQSQTDTVSLVSSEPFGEYSWSPLHNQEIIVL